VRTRPLLQDRGSAVPLSTGREGDATAELAGKVALVTGGSRGIGAASARRLAEGGADMALIYVSAAEKAHAVVAEVEAAGRRGLALVADSADWDALIGAVERTVDAFGRRAGEGRAVPVRGCTLKIGRGMLSS
jgi:NAD(P)-dependent dehydrogenase (short-subunit alcohol dehydrogenase family)